MQNCVCNWFVESREEEKLPWIYSKTNYAKTAIPAQFEMSTDQRFAHLAQYLPATGAIILPHLGGIIGALITRKEVKTWYETLRRPSWRPPNWAFAPVWTTLYTSMGCASYLVWRDGGSFKGPAKLPLMLYGANLALNWLWTPIFFGAHKKGLALIEIGALWGTIGACVYTFAHVNPVASYLMLPYWAWVTLATALTYCIWRDNKDKTE